MLLLTLLNRKNETNSNSCILLYETDNRHVINIFFFIIQYFFLEQRISRYVCVYDTDGDFFVARILGACSSPF